MNWNNWVRSWWMIGNHAGVDLRAAVTITCKICGQIYDSYETSHGNKTSVQGHDICAESRKTKDGRWIIICGYGSDFDLREFWYLKDFPTEPVDGICDWCIRRMLRDGVIMDSGKEPCLSFVGMEPFQETPKD